VGVCVLDGVTRADVVCVTVPVRVLEGVLDRERVSDGVGLEEFDAEGVDVWVNVFELV